MIFVAVVRKERSDPAYVQGPERKGRETAGSRACRWWCRGKGREGGRQAALSWPNATWDINSPVYP